MDRMGGDLSRMDELKAQFDKEGLDVERLIRTLDGWVTNIIGTEWFGPAAERFRDAWLNEYKRSLTGLRQALGEAATEIQRRREALQQAAG